MSKRKKLTSRSGPTKSVPTDVVVSSFCPWLLASCGLLLWIPHSTYLFTLFENDRFFSHLSDMEREMSYRTEMGLYFSYYKTLVDAPSLVDGIQRITNDNVTEAGHTINTLQRFNLYPELYLAAAFRAFRQLTRRAGVEFESCFQVRRGNDLPPVMSCEGMGNMHYFYMHGTFLVAGGVLPAVFWMGALLSDSYLGGFLSAGAFVANHGHATRVQWTPPLRESFGYPAFALQLCFLTWILRFKEVSRFAYAGFVFLTLHFILFWQFSGFVLFTQLCCLFATYVLNLLSSKKAGYLLHFYAVAFIIGYLGLCGNAMLLSSLFFTALLSFYSILLCDHVFHWRNMTIVQRVMKIVVFLSLTIGLKYVMNNGIGIRDDNHVFDILRSKFTNYSDFHTRLYTCAAEFDFVDSETLRSISLTGLLPLAFVSLSLVVVYGFRLFVLNGQDPEPNETRSEIVFNVGQLLCFSFMAILIMRLKLFAVPQLCAVLPVVFNTELQPAILGRKVLWNRAILIACIGLVAFRGRENVQKQMAISGEFSNENQERLFRWIIKSTSSNAVFAGSMPLMANLKLTTLRPIFNHPHYEDEGIRNRTMEVYSVYSRQQPENVHANLKRLGINFFIFESQHCGEHRRSECSYLGIWDSVDPARRSNQSICNRFLDPIERGTNYEKLFPFRVVYNSFNYAVLKI